MTKKILISTMVLMLTVSFGQVGLKVEKGAFSVPKLLNYQGYLTDDQGNPTNNPSLAMTFSIYDASGAGNLKWTENQNVKVEKGIFNVTLGSVTPIPDTVFAGGTDRWLELIAGGQTLTPRTRITAMGYAYTATYSDTAEYAKNAAADNHWNFLVSDGADTTLQMGGRWGIARFGNTLYGNADSTHVNLGIACTTGLTGQNFKYNTIAGGLYNSAANRSTVAGGQYNSARGEYSTVGGGSNNIASGWTSGISGGSSNVASNDYATVGGGFQNTASGLRSFVGGGYLNSASNQYATVSGGTNNTTGGNYATVGGGLQNSAIYMGTVAGGAWNNASTNATIAGGVYNSASGLTSTVSGGYQNLAAGTVATVGGGRYNKARGQYSVVSGGGGANQADSNSAIGDYSAVGGGTRNTASGYIATVGGGVFNTASGQYTTVSGGSSSTTGGNYATVGGGQSNSASGLIATVGGGVYNTASGHFSTVSGGQNNTASDSFNFIGGGYLNRTAGKYSAILGGYADTITSGGSYSYLFGIQSKLTQDSTFMVDLPHVWFGTEAAGYEFPRSRGTNGQVMVTDGSGMLSWSGITYVDSARVAANAHTLQGKDTVALDLRWVNEGQINSITNTMIQDAAVTMPKIAQAGATAGQVIKWNGTTWQPAADSSMDNDWTISGNRLYPAGNYGLAMRSSNVLYGTNDYTHVCLGIASTTGTSGQNYEYCTVGGGYNNRARMNYATVSGGYDNEATAYATVGGGNDNDATNNSTTIAGGSINTASGAAATIGGGQENINSGDWSILGGGYRNTVSGNYATVSGGAYNRARGLYSVVSGGGGASAADSNSAIGNYSAIGGGYRNIASGNTAVIGGGISNTASQPYATIGGGQVNTASGYAATVGGGWDNTAIGERATVGGGQQNTASGYIATVGGGQLNTADYQATVGGGYQNTASGLRATIGGGERNTASGPYSAVGGGYADTVAGDYSVAAGYTVRLTSAADYTFAFGRDFTTSTPNAVIFHNSVNPIKVGIGTTAPDTTLHIVGDIKIVDGNQGAGKVLTSDANGLGTWQSAPGDNDWSFRVTDGSDTTLVTGGQWGIARAGNALYGNADSTHVNLGVACTTGTSGQNYKYCTVAGGYRNTASNWYATVGGGERNTAYGYATVAGGQYNNAAGGSSTVGGGAGNTAGNSYATVGGGSYNSASGIYAMVPGGYQASASLHGQFAHASGEFHFPGDAQTSVYVLRTRSIGSSWYELYLDGDMARLTIASGRVMTFDLLIVGSTSGGSKSAGYKIQGVIKNAAGTTAFVGTPTVTVLGENDAVWDVQVGADNTNDALTITVQGRSGDDIGWVATVRTSEVAY